MVAHGTRTFGQPSDEYLPETASDRVDLLQHLPGFVTITSGPDHVVAFTNAGLRELTRYRYPDGRRLADALPAMSEQAGPLR